MSKNLNKNNTRRKSGWPKAILVAAVVAGALKGINLITADKPEAKWNPEASPIAYALLTPENRQYVESGFPVLDIIEADDSGYGLYHFDDVRSIGISDSENEYAQFLLKERVIPSLSKYPPAFFKNLAGLRLQMQFTGELSVYSPEFDWWTPAAGVTKHADDASIILINIWQPLSTIDHELHHAITDHISIHFGQNITLENIDTTLINITNDAGLSYKTDTPYGFIMDCTEVPVGFASCYGQWNVNEDGATIAEMLLTGNRAFYKRLEQDPVLQKKAEAIMHFYYVLSEGAMDYIYFDDIRHNKRALWQYPDILILP
ncbi:hypothetical protein IT418_03435 [bacterium]|nr:hypothetical protein [bacterium]